jgi:hypothetical protein
MCLLLALPGCERKSPQKTPEEKPLAIEPGDINLKETRLATIPEDYKVRQVFFSADGSRVVYIAKNREGKEFIVSGDQPGPQYDAVYKDRRRHLQPGRPFLRI